jgi:hypothetical protein
MTQQDQQEQGQNTGIDPDDERLNTGDESAGSQAATTGYGTGPTQGQRTAPAQQGQDMPSNAGNAGLQGEEGGPVSEERKEQMSHADGSSEADDTDV